MIGILSDSESDSERYEIETSSARTAQAVCTTGEHDCRVRLNFKKQHNNEAIFTEQDDINDLKETDFTYTMDKEITSTMLITKPTMLTQISPTMD